MEFEWVKKMNEMFEANPYTDNGRVVVEYAPKCGVIVVKVMDEVSVVYIDEYTEYGLMCRIMCKVSEMYNKIEAAKGE